MKRILLVTMLAVSTAACTGVQKDDASKTTTTTQTTVPALAIDATAPATIKAGTPLSIDVVVRGVQLVKADGDTSGRTGHLHAFIDKEPVAGAAIPVGDPTIIHSAVSPIVVPAPGAGTHTIWVVVGNGNHVAFTPLLADKLAVTVS